MSELLLHQIDRYMATHRIGEHRFGMLAARNGRLVERLRQGGRLWPDTEARVREFIARHSRDQVDGRSDDEMHGADDEAHRPREERSC